VGPLGDLLFELAAEDTGRIVYRSRGLAGSVLPAQSTPVMHMDLSGRDYGSAQMQQGRWRLRILEPRVGSRKMLALIVRDLGLSILISAPLVLLPLWLAVRRGLAPLRVLVQQIKGRRPGDFAPIAVNLQYVELQPLVVSFNALFAQSRDALARERALVQDAAHELRTPLAVIATQAHALANSPAGPSQHEALGRLEGAIARASHQVHQVLTLARVEGDSVRAVVKVDCVEMVRTALIDIEPRATSRNVDLSLNAPDSLEAHLDRLAFHSVLENLMVNALNHAQGAKRIQIALGTQGTELVLSVSDDGCGIPAEEHALVFQRFHRGRDASAPGSGLGLAIVREAARLMGGDVHIVPGLDAHGVGFELRVPWKQA